MDLSIYKNPDGLEIIEFAMSSPEEMQQYERALCYDLPDGMYRDLRKSSREVKQQGSMMRVPTLVLGPAKIGERLRLPGETDKPPRPVGQDPIPAALTIPQAVIEATEPQLETMAARNGVEVNDKWRGKNREFRNATVAKAMQITNKR